MRDLESYRPMRRLHFIFLTIIFSLSAMFAQESHDEAKSLVIESIEIEGNTKTKPHVIRNYLPVKEGDSITKAQMLAIEFRLRQTNFFKEVDMYVVPGSEKGMASVLVKVKERKWPFLQFKSGFNELDGWYITPLGIRLDNILGRGNVFGLDITLGDRVVASRLEYIRPFIFGTEYDFEISLLGHNRQFLHFLKPDGAPQQQYEQEVRDGGILIGLNGNSGLAKLFSVAFIAQNVMADSVLTIGSGDDRIEVLQPEFFNVPSDTQKIRKAAFSATVDTRNSRGYPTNGWWGAFSYELSAKDLGSFADYNKFIVDLRRYQPIWKKVVLALHAKAGSVGDNAPFYEKFYLGGPNSVRGYADRSLTPEGYAANLAIGSAELRLPLTARRTPDRFNAAFFVDTGYAWNEGDEFDFANFNTGLGFGVRIKLPIIGILRSDFAWSTPDSEFQFHLSLGQAF